MNDLSLESMIGSLFQETAKFGLESEDLVDETGEVPAEITDVIESDEYETGTVADEVTGTDEPDGDEVVTGDVATSEVPAGDSPALAEESARHLGDAALMAFALRTAESYQWSNESEDNVFKKFWAWIKKIFEKIKLGLVTFFRRVSIWIAGDMKKYEKWARENKSDLAKAEGNAKAMEVTMKLKLPQAGALKETRASIVTFVDLVTKKSGAIASDNADEFKSILETADKNTVKKMNETMYGKDASAKEVKASEFLKTLENGTSGFGAALATISADIRKQNEGNAKLIKDASEAVKVANTNANGNSNATDDQKKNRKKNAQAFQIMLNNATQVNIWATSERIKIAGNALRFAQKVLAKHKGSAEKKD